MRGLASDTALNASTGKVDIPYATKLELVRSILANNAEICAGSVAGTGAAIEVVTPFDPGFVWLLKNSGTGDPIQMLKHPGHATASAMKTVAAGTVSTVAADGITLGTKKFTIGTDADINENGETILWLAIGFRNYSGYL